MEKQRNFRVGKVAYNMGKMEEAAECVENKLDRSEHSTYVVFAGVPGVVSAQKSKEVEEAYQKAGMVMADGMPIAKLAQKFGHMDCERCAGPDVMKILIRRGLKNKASHFFYGSTPEALEKLEAALKEEFPDIVIAGKIAPPFRPLTPEEDEIDIGLINEAGADYVWIGLGAPKQDLWMYQHYERIKKGTLVGVGAAFKFHSNTVKRAPEWVQKIGMEWFYRMLKEPKLFHRYFYAMPRFFGIVIRDLVKGTYREAAGGNI